MSEQKPLIDWFNKPLPVVQQKPNANPCIALYGIGPDNTTCKNCVHLRYALSRNPNARKHWKCDLRKLTHGAATDHLVGHQACGRYQERTEEYFGG